MRYMQAPVRLMGERVLSHKKDGVGNLTKTLHPRNVARPHVVGAPACDDGGRLRRLFVVAGTLTMCAILIVVFIPARLVNK
jgi:hypothetical protein